MCLGVLDHSQQPQLQTDSLAQVNILRARLIFSPFSHETILPYPTLPYSLLLSFTPSHPRSCFTFTQPAGVVGNHHCHHTRSHHSRYHTAEHCSRSRQHAITNKPKSVDPRRVRHHLAQINKKHIRASSTLTTLLDLRSIEHEGPRSSNFYSLVTNHRPRRRTATILPITLSVQHILSQRRLRKSHGQLSARIACGHSHTAAERNDAPPKNE